LEANQRNCRTAKARDRKDRFVRPPRSAMQPAADQPTVRPDGLGTAALPEGSASPCPPLSLIGRSLDARLAALLTRLNLTEHCEAFARERITLRSLGELTDDELKELGVRMG